MARRARTLWRELEAESGDELLIECGSRWFAHARGRLGGGVASGRCAPGHPGRAARRRARPRALFPSLRAATTSRSCCTSPRPACCARSARCGRSAAQAEAHGARLVRGAGAPGRRAVVLDDGARLEADRVVWACGGWLRAAVPRPRLAARRRARSCSSSTAARRGAARPAGSTTTARSTAPATSTGSASRSRSTSRARRSTPTRRCPATTAEIERSTRATCADRFPALADAPLRRRDDLPLRALARLALHRRARTPSTRASGSSAAAPATASSTARRWPSASRRAWDGRRAAAGALRARPSARRAARCAPRASGAQRDPDGATNHGPACTISPPPSSPARSEAVNQRL